MLFPFRLKYEYLKPVHATVVIFLLVAAIFILQVTQVVDYERWGLVKGEGQPERIISHTLLHGSWIHLFLNLAAFAVFAQIVNAAIGSGLFLVVCLFCGISSAALELLLDDRLSYVPCVGLSGVVAGLVVMSSFWVPKIKVTFIFWFVFMIGFIDFAVWAIAATWVVCDAFSVLATDWRGEGTAYWGHLGGFAAGFICHFLIRRFKVVELKGFMLAPFSTGDRVRLGRRARVARAVKPQEEGEALQLVATCLRCGYRTILKEPPGEAALRCRKCGQSSSDHREKGDDPGLRKRKIKCGVILGAAAALLFGLSWHLMS